MKIATLQLLCEEPSSADSRKPLIERPNHEGREWSLLKDTFRFSRRYSIVATEVSLLALNVLFLFAKADKSAPTEIGEVTLALLSTIGILSLHYYVDVIWKAMQDTRFAVKVKNKTITAISATKVVQVGSNVALTAGNFFAAIQGVTGHERGQMQSYHDMILWGEISLGMGFVLTLLSMAVTFHTSWKMRDNLTDFNPEFVANIRYCMDKDTLWHLIDTLREVGEEDREKAAEAIETVKRNITTQIRVTLGGKIILIIIGDALQAVEKAYTPNSLVSAIINCSVSTAYAIKIIIEKGMEYQQRRRLDQA